MMLLVLLALAGCALSQTSSGSTTSTTTSSGETTSTTTTTTTVAPTTTPAPTCASQTTQASCTAFGSQSPNNGACVWCGTSATQGHCRQPAWFGTYSCPVVNGPNDFFHYQCDPGHTVGACGSNCLNTCETRCRDFRAPVTTVTEVENCASNVTTVSSGVTRNLTTGCLPLSNGASVGVIAYPNGTYRELNYMCANCLCEPTCVHARPYCSCTRLAGSNVFVIVAPLGNNCSAAEQNSGTTSSTAAGGTSGSTTVVTTTPAASPASPAKDHTNSAAVLSASMLLALVLILGTA